MPQPQMDLARTSDSVRRNYCIALPQNNDLSSEDLQKDPSGDPSKAELYQPEQARIQLSAEIISPAIH
jgi:hypothetical protein